MNISDQTNVNIMKKITQVTTKCKMQFQNDHKKLSKLNYKLNANNWLCHCWVISDKKNEKKMLKVNIPY